MRESERALGINETTESECKTSGCEVEGSISTRRTGDGRKDMTLIVLVAYIRDSKTRNVQGQEESTCKQTGVVVVWCSGKERKESVLG